MYAIKRCRTIWKQSIHNNLFGSVFESNSQFVEIGYVCWMLSKVRKCNSNSLDKILISLLIIKLKGNLYIYKLFNDTAL